jgi:hypothetical protein
VLNQLFVAFWIGISRRQTCTLCLLKCGAVPIAYGFTLKLKQGKSGGNLQNKAGGLEGPTAIMP